MLRGLIRLAYLVALSLFFGTASRAAAADPPTDAKAGFLRLSRDSDKQPEFLETAVVHYVPDDAAKDVSIDLIGAVHIGDKAYYEKLNKLFEDYDVLLYELVAKDGTRIPKGGGKGSNHPVAVMQTGMKDMLELEHQLQHVDYQAANFVHADMTPDAFSQSMADRGENIWTIVFRMMGHQLAQQNKNPDRQPEADLLLAMFDKNRALAMKRILAEQFDDLEEAMSVFAGPGGSTLITERNKRALQVLGEQLAAGKKRIGVFYGAGHMPDMEERLVKDFDVHRDSERWIVAWDLRSAEQRRADAAREKREAAKEAQPVAP